MIEVRRYQRLDGTVPLTEWLFGLRDARVRAKLEIRFRRAPMGSFGDAKPIDEGVLELRDVAEAYGGVASVPQEAGITRDALYRALSPAGNPTLKRCWPRCTRSTCGCR